jgi:hypothetical protein
MAAASWGARKMSIHKAIGRNRGIGACADLIVKRRARSKPPSAEATNRWRQTDCSCKAERADELQARRNGQGHQALGR